MKLDNKIVVVTGAGRGIGRIIAITMASEGAKVIICSRNKKELESVKKEIEYGQGNCDYFVLDVANKKHIESFINSVIASYGRVDAIINNAGWSHKEKNIEEITDEEYKKTIRTNVDSVFYIIRKVMPSMRKQNNGFIINISSSTGKQGRAGLSAYAASKFAVHGFTESVAKELDGTNVKCITLCLMGGFNTPLREELFGKEDAKKQKNPLVVAEVIREILVGKLKVPTGASLVVPDRTII